MQRFGHLFFWIAHIIYLIDFGVPKMVILVFLLGVIRGGVSERCHRMSEQMSGWPSTYVPTLGYSSPLWNGMEINYVNILAGLICIQTN